MRKTKHIKSFLFDKAQYRVGDENGNELLMKVDYKNGKYALVDLEFSNEKMKSLKREAGEIATDLIKRKSKVNFAKKN
jgi:hypothetical protein